ncbi:hypothetical protein [Planotetraspora sp. GP83]|uniref:hypothetical protein n=1 Tax=Planotetraspora sp. GP83 TaxID=3156264 RepID=UPI00351725FB
MAVLLLPQLLLVLRPVALVRLVGDQVDLVARRLPEEPLGYGVEDDAARSSVDLVAREIGEVVRWPR